MTQVLNTEPLQVSENHKLELTTLRKDIKTDGRHAEVEFTDDWKRL